MTTLPRMSLARSGAALAAAALIALLCALPAQAKTTDCSRRIQPIAESLVPKSNGSKEGYVTYLKVRNMSCKASYPVLRAFHRCRHSHGGGRGRCPQSASVKGFHCTEGKRTYNARRPSKATELDGTVTCTRGSHRIVHYYTQFL